MPYKDKEQARESARLSMERRRKGLTSGDNNEGDNIGGVNMLSRPNGADYNPNERLYNSPHYPDGTLRYLGPLSDGQVLDRLTV